MSCQFLLQGIFLTRVSNSRLLHCRPIHIYIYIYICGTSLVAQTVKNLRAMKETWVPSLGLEDLLEEEVATHSGILAWRIPWTEEPGGLQCMG